MSLSTRVAGYKFIMSYLSDFILIHSVSSTWLTSKCIINYPERCHDINRSRTLTSWWYTSLKINKHWFKQNKKAIIYRELWMQHFNMLFDLCVQFLIQRLKFFFGDSSTLCSRLVSTRMEAQIQPSSTTHLCESIKVSRPWNRTQLSMWA